MDRHSSSLIWAFAEHSAGNSWLPMCPTPFQEPIFVHEFNLFPHLRASRLVDHTTHLSVHCLQKTSVLRRISTVPHSIPDRFSSILRRFPNLTNPFSASTSPEHQVVNYIRTKGPTCHSRPRRLPLEKRKAAIAEFEHMVQLGIIRRSEQNAWASPLHLVAKPSGHWRPCGDFRALIVTHYRTLRTAFLPSTTK